MKDKDNKNPFQPTLSEWTSPFFGMLRYSRRICDSDLQGAPEYSNTLYKLGLFQTIEVLSIGAIFGSAIGGLAGLVK